jgi:acyl-CoA thioester hydrolase
MIPGFAPPRQELSLFPVQFERSPTFHDLGPCGHVSRATILRWFEQARLAIETRVFGPSRPREHPPLASVRLELLEPADGGATFDVGVGVSSIAVSSFSCTFGLFDGDRCIALGESVSVHATPAGPAPLPGAARERLGAIGGVRIPGRRVDRDPARLVRDAYPFGVDVRARLGDVDPVRSVGNVALAGWYLDGLAELHIEVLGYPVDCMLDGLAPGSLSVDHLAEVGYPGTYRLGLGVLAIDECSVHYACGLFDGAHCLGLAEAIGSHDVTSGRSQGSLAGRFDGYRMRR